MVSSVGRMRQAQVLRALGDGAVLWVDPAKIELYSGSARLAVTRYRRTRLAKMGFPKFSVFLARKALARFEPYVIPEHCFGAIEPIESVDKYLKVKDLIAHRDDIAASAWSRELHRQLRERGRAKHKRIRMRSADEIEAFLRDYVLDLVASMERRGYDVEKGGEFGSAQIGPDGQLIKSGSGTHRFCVARLLGLTRFPLRVVGIHAGWATGAAGTDGRLTVADLGMRLKEIGERYR